MGGCLLGDDDGVGGGGVVGILDDTAAGNIANKAAGRLLDHHFIPDGDAAGPNGRAGAIRRDAGGTILNLDGAIGRLNADRIAFRGHGAAGDGDVAVGSGYTAFTARGGDAAAGDRDAAAGIDAVIISFCRYRAAGNGDVVL